MNTQQQQRINNLNLLRATFNTLQSVANMLTAEEYPTKITLIAASKTIYDLYKREEQIATLRAIPINLSTLSAPADIRLPDDPSILPVKARQSEYFRLWAGAKYAL